MVRIERGNVVLRVKEEEVQYYLNLGYNVTDEQGNILKAAIPINLGVLQKAFIDNQKTIETLNTQVANLTSELEKLKAENRKLKAKTKSASKE